MKAYKIMRIGRDGNLYPLFINKKEITPLNEWLTAECHPTKGFAVRQGWHCCFKPLAPHLKLNLKSGERRTWVECDAKDYQAYDRPESQGEAWILADKMKVNRILSLDEVDEILQKGL